MSISKTKLATNFIWRFAERIGAQGVKLLIELVLARILLPDDYGLIALVTVFITTLQVFVDSGLGNALIQKKDADDIDFSSVFWFNIIWCLILYGFLFLASPLFARFYDRPELSSILRVLGIQMIIAGVKNVEQAYVSRTMQFKRFFFATLGGTLGAAVVGIWMAYHGFGVWALVAQHLVNTLMDTAILWITVSWKPKFLFSFSRLKTLFSYGWKLLVSSLIDTVYSEIRQLIIGRIYSSSDLAFYNRGRQFPLLFVGNVNTAIDSILLPTLSQSQDNKSRVKAMTRRAIQISVYILAPMMIGFACVGEPLVRLLLTDKWLPSVPFMRLFCVTFILYPIHTANLNAIKAMGRSDIFLKLEIIKKVIGLTALFLTMRISVMAMAYSLLITSVLSSIINSWPNRALLEYSYMDQMRDIVPSILLSVFMGGIVYCIKYIGMKDWMTLLIQIVLGVVVYWIGSVLFHMESYYYILRIFKEFIQKNKQKETSST